MLEWMRRLGCGLGYKAARYYVAKMHESIKSYAETLERLCTGSHVWRRSLFRET